MSEPVKKRFGDYEVLDELGRGGMGKVYRVRNVISDRIEAMKILLPNLVGQQELADRFLREIKLLASLNHPNIAALRTALTVDNQLVMIMEYVEGISLAARLKYGPIAMGDALKYIDQVLDALHYAHQQHVVHRDIKPANMMLTPQGIVKLMDFGIARSGDEPALTKPGTAPGSLNYMSPEQVKGQAADARSDLYSVGISLYEMLTGQLPFQADSDYALMAAHLNETPRALIELQAGLPPALNDLVMKVIEKDPALRFQSADEFRRALSRVRPAAAPVQPSTTARLATIGDSAVSPALLQDATAAISSREPSTPDNPLSSNHAQTVVDARPPSQPSLHAQPRTGVPSGPAGESRMKSNRALYMALGAIMVIAAMVGIGIYSRRAEADPVAASTPPAVLEELAVPNAATPEAIDPAVQIPAPAQKPPAGNRESAKGAGAARNQQTRESDRPPDPATSSAGLEQLEREVDQLTVRAGSVNSSLDRLQGEQAGQGLGLRGDMAARQESMKLNLSRAQDAVNRNDAARATRYRDLAERDVEALEKFLGR